MELTGLGGGIMVVIAAVLWMIFLVPNWLKRREYLATERNAVRLQQTIRILAETAEAPVPRRRSKKKAEPRDRTDGALQAPVGRVLRAPTNRPTLASRRRRRTRIIASIVLLGSLIACGLQLTPMLTAGAEASWPVLAGSAITALASLTALTRLAKVARAHRTPRVIRRRHEFVDHALEQRSVRPAEWTPVPVPKPLYLSRAVAPESVTTPAAHAETESESLRRAAAHAETALRSVQLPAVSAGASAPDHDAPPALIAKTTNRFAAMGIVDDLETGVPDVDAVLARRRAAG